MNKYQDKLDQNGITQELVRELFDYDGDNGLLIRKLKYGKPYNKPCGIKPNADEYGLVNVGGKNYLAHLIIWLWHHGPLPGFVKHLDKIPMNNCIENLVAEVNSENQRNHRLHIDSTSGYPGVSLDKDAKKYQARIRVNNEPINLGLFDTAEEAFRAYMLAKLEHHPSSPAAPAYYRRLIIELAERNLRMGLDSTVAQAHVRALMATGNEP